MPPPSAGAGTDAQPTTGKAEQATPALPAAPELYSSRLLASPAIRTGLASLCSALLDAAITPWWSRLSPTNEPALHDEAERLVGIVGSELARRLEEAERQGRLERLLREEVPALVGRYIEIWRAAQLGMETEGEQGVRIASASASGLGEDDDEERARRRFEVYNALWPSVYVSYSPSSSSPAPAPIPRLSHARLRALADALLPSLLPAEELQSRAAAALVRDLLAMLLRISLEKGSAGWMWVRAGQKMLDRAAAAAAAAEGARRSAREGGAGAAEEDEIVLLPSLEEMRSAIKEGCKRALPLAQRCLQASREYFAFDRQPPQRQDDDHHQPPPYQEKGTHHTGAAPVEAVRPAPSASSNYLCLLCTLLNLPATYTGKVVQGAITLLRLFGSHKLDRSVQYLLSSCPWLPAFAASLTYFASPALFRDAQSPARNPPLAPAARIAIPLPAGRSALLAPHAGGDPPAFLRSSLPGRAERRVLAAPRRSCETGAGSARDGGRVGCEGAAQWDCLYSSSSANRGQSAGRGAPLTPGPTAESQGVLDAGGPGGEVDGEGVVGACA